MTPDLAGYDLIIVAFSGGKDSLACVLHLLDLGIPRSKMELWHHEVDGREGSTLMDWPCTRGYSQAVADHLRIPLLFSWRAGGIEREMLRNASATAAVKFETSPGSAVTEVGGDGPTHNKRGDPYVRRLFPQTSPDLAVRWCSAVVKIDVAARVFGNDPRLNRGTLQKPQQFLIVTGERREEGKVNKQGVATGRAAYDEFEEYRASSRKRRVDQWRPVIDYPEAAVWDLMRKHGIVPHPAYRLGFGRVSCSVCIFGTDAQWAAIEEILPEQLVKIGRYEDEFGKTIARDGRNVRDRAQNGTSLIPAAADRDLIAIAQGRLPMYPVYVDPSEWQMPAGAFKETGGPT